MDKVIRLAGDISNPQGEVMAKVTVVLSIIAVAPNAPPQMDPAARTITNLTVGVPRALGGISDPDGDQVTVTVKAGFENKISVTPAGVLTALVPLGNAEDGISEAVEIELDDGKSGPPSSP
jgi:hypothetical protein